MPSNKAVLLSEDEIKALLPEGFPGYTVERMMELEDAALEKLRAALQQEEHVEEVVEYRVMMRREAEEWMHGPDPFTSYEAAEKRRKRAPHISRIQSRQTLTGPWTDLEDQEGSE